MSLLPPTGTVRPPLRCLVLVGLGLLSFDAIAPVARGQEATASAGADESKVMAAEILGFDTVEARAVDLISQDLDVVRQEIAEADARLSAARPVESAAKWRIEPKKKSIEATKSNLELAKKEKREADAIRLEKLKKRQELELKYLERVAEMRGTDIERFEKDKAYAEARKQALDHERNLSEKRAALKALPEGDPAAPARRVELYEFEKQALAALKEAGEKGRDAAEKREEMAEKRIRVYEAIVEFRKLP